MSTRKYKEPCFYCGSKIKLMTGKQVYPHREDLWGKFIYHCTNCDARVGCHKMNFEPYGRVANAILRKARSQAHAYFDLFWKRKQATRKQCYAQLAKEMGLTIKQCHIGSFNEEQCAEVLEITGKWKLAQSQQPIKVKTMNEETKITNNPQLTEGQWRVGVTFNPGGHDSVNEIKRATAWLIDYILENGKDPRTAELAATGFEQAAMDAVKSVTKPDRPENLK